MTSGNRGKIFSMTLSLIKLCVAIKLDCGGRTVLVEHVRQHITGDNKQGFPSISQKHLNGAAPHLNFLRCMAACMSLD